MDYFIRFAEQLCVLHEKDPEQTSWPEVRSWLQEAAVAAPDSAMPVWTNMLKLAVAHEAFAMPPNAGVVLALRQYLDRLATLQPTDLADTVGLPMFMSLVEWVKPSGKRGHPTLEELGLLGWQPAALLRAIEDNRDTIVRAGNAARGYARPLYETGAGLLLKRIGDMFLNGAWAPAPDPVYEILFEGRLVSGQEFREQDRQLIRGILDAAPSGLYKALWFARRQEFFREEHLQALFPLPLGYGNDAYMLDELVALVVEEPAAVQGQVMPLLTQHHPELAQLVALHLSLFPDACAGRTHAQALVEPYRRLCGQLPQEFGPVDADVFGQP